MLNVSHPLYPLIQEFLADLQNCGLAKGTVTAYRGTLRNFTRFFNGSVTEINAGALRRYLAKVGGSPNNRARHFSNLKIFLNWCYRFEYIPVNPIHKLETPRSHAYPPRPIPTTHLELIAEAIQNTDTRTRLLFTLLLETGMRIRETLSIKFCDIDLSHGEEKIIVCGKGDRLRAIPLVPGLLSLELLEREVSKFGAEQIYLFPQPGDNSQSLSYKDASIMWRQLQKQTGTRYHVHQLRHSCATHLLNCGVSIEAIQKLLGHKKLSTTSRYAQLEHSVLRREMAGHLRRQKGGEAGVPER
ncbi:MAG: tyrosine-type recombinase/integrase [Desulfotomaculaceae bacterium]|nr:tyrosine-type recombinase/integrase [Desulfotomaculaceae bacterium]